MHGLIALLWAAAAFGTSLESVRAARASFLPAPPALGVVDDAWAAGFANSFDDLRPDDSLLQDAPMLRQWVERAASQDIDLLAPENRDIFAPLVPHLAPLLADLGVPFGQTPVLRRFYAMEIAAGEAAREGERYAEELLGLAIPGVAARLEDYQRDALLRELETLRWQYGLLLPNGVLARANRAYMDLHAARRRRDVHPENRDIGVFATRGLLGEISRWQEAEVRHLGEALGRLVSHIADDRPLVGEHGNIKFLTDEFYADHVAEVKFGRNGSGRSHRVFARLLRDDRLVLLAVRPRTNVDDSYEAIDRMALRVGDGRQDIVGLDAESHPLLFSWLPGADAAAQRRPALQPAPRQTQPPPKENGKEPRRPPRSKTTARSDAASPAPEVPAASEPPAPSASRAADFEIERLLRRALPRRLSSDAGNWDTLSAWSRSGDYLRLAAYLERVAAPEALERWPAWFPWIQDWVRDTRRERRWFDWLIRHAVAVRRPLALAALLRARGDSPQVAACNRAMDELLRRLVQVREGRGDWLAGQRQAAGGNDGERRKRLGAALLDAHYAWVAARHAEGALTAGYARWANDRVRQMVEGSGEFRARLQVALLWSDLDERARILHEVDRYSHDPEIWPGSGG